MKATGVDDGNGNLVNLSSLMEAPLDPDNGTPTPTDNGTPTPTDNGTPTPSSAVLSTGWQGLVQLMGIISILCYAA
jgi:hypothetical protein